MLVCKYVHENGLVVMLAAKRSAGVALQVNLREYTSCIPPPSANKAAHSGFEIQRCHQEYQWPTKGHVSTKNLK